MNFTPTSDLETKSFSELSIFDGLGANFKKHLDTHLAQGNLEENKPDSLFVESVVIHNDINLEEELSKIRDDDEGAFKILSMSFYDKKTRAAPTKPPGQSPTRLEENNRLYKLRDKAKTPVNLDVPAKAGSQPSLTPFANEVHPIHQIRDRKLGSPKVGIRTDLKLFAIKERVKLDTSSQLSPQKPNFHLSLVVSPHEKSNTQTSIKDRLKSHEKEIMKPQKPLSPRKESPSREPSMEKKYTILDMKISDLVKSKSPTFAVKKSSSKERIFASPPRITFNVSPKGFRFHPKINTSNEKLTISRETSEHKLSLSRKNETEQSPLRSPSPVFALNKNVLAKRFDLQRVSLNNINYMSTKDLPVKENKTPSSKIVQKVNEVVMQQQYQLQTQHQQPQVQQLQPVKTELAKGYRSNQSFYTKNGSRRGSNLEQKNSKLLLNQKLRINTDDNSALKISMRDISDSSIYLTGSRSVKGKMNKLDFSSLKQRDISGFSSSKDMFDPVKLNFKSQSKSKLKDTRDRSKEMNNSKQNHPVLPLQSRGIDI